MSGLVHIETRAFYSTEAEGNPNTTRYQPGEQAFHAWAKGEHAALMERDAAERRPEIGRVEQRTGNAGAWVVVHERLTAEERQDRFIHHWNEAVAAHAAGEFRRAGECACRAMEVMPRVFRQGQGGSLALELVRQRKPAEEALQEVLRAVEAMQ
jgi:hypothetical protein